MFPPASSPARPACDPARSARATRRCRFDLRGLEGRLDAGRLVVAQRRHREVVATKEGRRREVGQVPRVRVLRLGIEDHGVDMRRHDGRATAPGGIPSSWWDWQMKGG